MNAGASIAIANSDIAANPVRCARIIVSISVRSAESGVPQLWAACRSGPPLGRTGGAPAAAAGMAAYLCPAGGRVTLAG